MGRTRRTFSAQQKTQIALEALRERQTLSEIAPGHGGKSLMYTPPRLQPGKSRSWMACRRSSNKPDSRTPSSKKRK
jgi:hypothetical protein